jgi:hypothetical protein
MHSMAKDSKKTTAQSVGKAADPTKWLDRAAHIRGLGRGVHDRHIAPMFERLAARLEEIGIAKAEAEMRAKERRDGDEAASMAPRRRGISGGELNMSTRSEKDDHEKAPGLEEQGRRRP